MKRFLLLIIMAALFMGCTQPPKYSYITTKEEVTVYCGDTLWSIAGRYNKNIYILEYLETIKSLPENSNVLKPNRLLQPGDKITVLKVIKK